ncbi:MAG: tetratricopeptide repeat protein [Bacteroidia bacterium]
MKRVASILFCLLPFCLLAQIPQSHWQSLLDQSREHKLLHEIQNGLSRSAKQDRAIWFYWQGKALLQLEDWDQDRQASHQGLVRSPHSILNLAGICQALFKQNEQAKAEIYLAELQQQEIKLQTEEEFLILARTYYLFAEHQSSAKVLWYHAMERFPHSYRPHWELASIYLQSKQYELASNHFYALLEIKADYAPAILGLAKVAIAQNQLNLAADFINRSLKIDPDFAEAYRYRGQLWLRADRFEKAQTDYRTYLYYTGGDARSWIYYAAALYMAGYYYDSLEALDQVGTTSPALASIRYRLKAFAWADIGRWDSAQYWLESFQAETPSYRHIPADQAYWGAYLIREGQLEGEDFLVAAVAERPNLRHHYHSLADWWTERQQYDLAARFAERYVTSFARAQDQEYLWLGKLQYFAEDYEAAYLSVRQSLDHRPPSAEQYYWWGICARKLHLRSEMREAFSHLIDMLEVIETQSEQEQDYFLQACTVLALYYYQDAPSEAQDCKNARLYAQLALIGGGEKEHFDYILAACE